MTNYGTIDFNGITYTLTSQPDFTNRLLPYCQDNYNDAADGDTYRFEMGADVEWDDGNEMNEFVSTGTMYWIFEDVKGAERELDGYDYNKVNRVEEE